MYRFRSVIVVLVLVTMLLGACAPAATPAVIEKEVVKTVIVEKEVPVEKKVVETVVVEKVVAAQPAPVTIKWLEWWDPEYGVEIMDELIAGFNEQYPHIKVERVVVAWGSMYDALISNAQAKVSEYDLLGMERVWMLALDKVGGVESLDPYIESAPETWKSALADGAIVRWQDSAKMFYWYMMPYNFAYNVDVFEKANLKPPTNWNELADLACKLKDDATGSYGLSLPLGMPAWNLLLFNTRLIQLGGRPLGPDGRVAFNSAEGVAALEYYKKLLDTGCIVPGSFTEQLAQSREFFATGKIAMIFDGPFIGTIVKQTNPNARVAYSPAFKDVTGGYVWAGSGLAIARNSRYKNEAWLLLQYLMQEDVALKMTAARSVPFSSKAAFATLSSSTDPILKEIPAMLNQDPEHNFFYPPLPNETTLREKFTEQSLAYYSGKKSAQEALDAAAAAWNAEIDKAMGK